MMNCGGQMKSFYGGCEDMSMGVVCPRPRRLDRLVEFNSQEFEAGDELLELLLKKGEEPNQIDLTGSFFCGSPPSRVSNPIIHDERFREDISLSRFVPAPVPSISTLLPQSSASPRQTFMPAKYSFKPAARRIEGFDCLNRDGRGCSIIAKA